MFFEEFAKIARTVISSAYNLPITGMTEFSVSDPHARATVHYGDGKETTMVINLDTRVGTIKNWRFRVTADLEVNNLQPK